MSCKSLCLVIVVALLVSPLSAEDAPAKKKKRQNERQRGMATQLTKRLEAVNFTDEQKAKIAELGKTADMKVKSIREQAGITNQLMQKRGQAQRSMKGSDLKGKELFAAINKQAGLNEQQVKGFKEINAVRTGLQREVIALLSDEQKQALPERMQRAAKKGPGKKGQGKKKNKAA